VKTPEGPVVTTPSIVISELLPNPVGDDEQLETVTVRNTGALSVSLEGWTLRDRSTATWHLAGWLAAGQAHTFRRDGQAMSLNNAGDEIVLVDAVSTERDRFVYSMTREGVAVSTGHYPNERGGTGRCDRCGVLP
jgi:Lamin Tail Domain